MFTFLDIARITLYDVGQSFLLSKKIDRTKFPKKNFKEKLNNFDFTLDIKGKERLAVNCDTAGLKIQVENLKKNWFKLYIKL